MAQCANMSDNDFRFRPSRALLEAFTELAACLRTKDFQGIAKSLAEDFSYVEMERPVLGKAAYLEAESGKADAYPVVEGGYEILSAFEHEGLADSVVRGTFLVDTTRTGRLQRYEGHLLQHARLRMSGQGYRFVKVHVFEMTMTVDGRRVIGFDGSGQPVMEGGVSHA